MRITRITYYVLRWFGLTLGSISLLLPLIILYSARKKIQNEPSRETKKL